ncbi:hypothetical protein COOONC_13192 [Cooperia oncophora]
MLLYFSAHDCLIKKYGIMHLGMQNGIVFQIDKDKPIDNVSTGRGNVITYATPASRETLPTLPVEDKTANSSAVAPQTTTHANQIGDIGGLNSGKALNRARRGWLIWMIFYGFFTGSLIALIIAGLILYFARRSVYACWYRGMYKRYGCDASGVSGGVTGSQFGTTATGASTMGGTTGSTMGTTGTTGTTGGTTGSTMGTTGGGTTGTTGGGTTGDGTTGGTSGTSGGDMVTM